MAERRNEGSRIYKEASTSESESQSETTNDSEEENKIVKRKATGGKKKKPEKEMVTSTPKEKIQKTKAKDGRRLIDLTNRVRLPGGRLGGYKEGYVSKAKRSRCKKTSPSTIPRAPEELTARVELELSPEKEISEEQLRTYAREPLMKMPSVTPQTPKQMKEVVATISKKPLVSLESLATPGPSRARSMRPPPMEGPGAAKNAPRPTAGPLEGEPSRSQPMEEDVQDQEMPATQPFQKDDDEVTTTEDPKEAVQEKALAEE